MIVNVLFKDLKDDKMKILQKYKKFYFNKLFIKKCVANAIQKSQTFLSESNNIGTCLLADTISGVKYDIK